MYPPPPTPYPLEEFEKLVNDPITYAAMLKASIMFGLGSLAFLTYALAKYLKRPHPNPAGATIDVESRDVTPSQDTPNDTPLLPPS